MHYINEKGLRRRYVTTLLTIQKITTYAAATIFQSKLPRCRITEAFRRFIRSIHQADNKR